MRILRPALATIDWPALAIALLAGVILLELQWGVLRTLGAAVLLSIAWRLVA
jgi:hypothetical protein